MQGTKIKFLAAAVLVLSASAWSPTFMGFAAGLAVFLTLLVGGAMVMFHKALDLEPDYAAG